MFKLLILTITILTFFGVSHKAYAQYSNGQIINIMNQINRSNEDAVKRNSLYEQNEDDEELFTIEEEGDQKSDKDKKPEVKVKSKNN